MYKEKSFLPSLHKPFRFLPFHGFRGGSQYDLCETQKQLLVVSLSNLSLWEKDTGGRGEGRSWVNAWMLWKSATSTLHYWCLNRCMALTHSVKTRHVNTRECEGCWRSSTLIAECEKPLHPGRNCLMFRSASKEDKLMKGGRCVVSPCVSSMWVRNITHSTFNEYSKEGKGWHHQSELTVKKKKEKIHSAGIHLKSLLKVYSTHS